MSNLASEIEKELQSLEPETARHFEQVVRDMLYLVKLQQTLIGSLLAPQAATPRTLADRLRNHPALGTWPAGLDADAHVDSLRREWGGGQ